jgi:hypothetical protein
MDDLSKLGAGSKIPPIANQVFRVLKKRKADDRGRRPQQGAPDNSEKSEEEKKQLVDIKDTDTPAQDATTEPGAAEVETGYEGHARPKKAHNPKIDVVI